MSGQSPEQRIAQLEERIDDLVEQHESDRNHLAKQLQEERQERRRLEDRVDELEAALDRVDERTSLLHAVKDASQLKVEERAGRLIQVAVENADDGRETIDIHAAKAALPGITRQQRYTAMERAAELVESDAVQYLKESRSSDAMTRLIVDAGAGDLPAVVGGQEVSGR